VVAASSSAKAYIWLPTGSDSLTSDDEGPTTGSTLRLMRRDPVELEIFKHLYHSIAEEMGAALRRTAFSPNIKERRDYSCAVFDGAGEVIAMGDHMPVHLGSMPMSVRAAIDAGAMEPGDMVMLNDPFRGPALDSMKGKTIAYLPISLGFDMAQAWGGVVKQEADRYGMKFVSQDPNWSTDAMAQALTNIIAQKPDVIVTQNPDLQSLARLLKQANAQGTYVIQVNMQGAVQTDAFVGPDLVGIGQFEPAEDEAFGLSPGDHEQMIPTLYA